MAQQTIKGFMCLPGRNQDSSLAFRNHLLDAASEKSGMILQMPKDGTVDKVGFRTGTVTTGATVDVRLETVDATTGLPTGTLLAANANGAQVIADANDNTWFLTVLTTGPTISKGDIFAIVIVNPAGSPGTLQISNIDQIDADQGYQYVAIDTGSWAKGTASWQGIGALEYSDGSYEKLFSLHPFDNITDTGFSSSSNPDRRGLRFQLPFPFRLRGVWINMERDGNYNVLLYDSDGTTVLETVSLDSDLRPATADEIDLVEFASDHSLSKDTNYRVAILPTTTTSVSVRGFTVDAVALMDGVGGGQNFHLTTTDGAPSVEGDWTNTTTSRFHMGLIIDGFDDGAGGGGGVTAVYNENTQVMAPFRAVPY